MKQTAATNADNKRSSWYTSLLSFSIVVSKSKFECEVDPKVQDYVTYHRQAIVYINLYFKSHREDAGKLGWLDDPRIPNAIAK